MFQKSARLGWTQILCQVIGYHMDQDPCSMLAVQPSIDDAENWSKEHIAEMLDVTPALAGKVAPPKSRDSKSTITQKHYPGGVLHINGANSPRGFRRISTRVVLFDECDAYPPTAGQEGDQIKLGIRRSEDYWNRKIAIGSTPTIQGISRVEKQIAGTSQGWYFLACPHCGGEHIRLFRQPEKPITLRGNRVPVSHLQWVDDDYTTAAWVCPHCDALIDHGHHRAMVESGRWVGEHWEHDGQSFRFLPGFAGYIGFRLWAGYSYSPNTTPAHLAREFLESKPDPDALKTFVNTVLGEPWEERGDTVDDEMIAERCEAWEGDVPDPVDVLVAGVDVQADRIELEVLGVGAGEETWSIDYEVLPGDPTQAVVWEDLKEVLARRYAYPDGSEISVAGIAVDAGHLSTVVHSFVSSYPSQFIWATAGQDGEKRPLVEPRDLRTMRLRKRSRGRKWAPEIVGVDFGKTQLYRRLRIAPPLPDADWKPGQAWRPGYCHFPADQSKYGPEYFAQLCAEKVVPRYTKGRPTRVWVKTRPRNEALDCRIYAMAAYHLLIMSGVTPAQMARWVQRTAKAGVAAPKPKQPAPKRRDSWFKR